jgi:heme/copper-type cytochrome/quinol oxidase subunit 2
MSRIAMHFKFSLFPRCLLGLAIALSMATLLEAQNQAAQIIEITAKKYEYSNSTIRVKAGTRIQLKITAIDHDHGFKIGTVPDGAAPNGTPGLVFASAQECWQLKKEQTTVIEFLAQTPGTYTFKCCHFCGHGHSGMKGQLIVEQ